MRIFLFSILLILLLPVVAQQNYVLKPTTQAHISSSIASLLETENSFVIDHSLTCSTGTAVLINAVVWLKSEICKYALVGGSEASNTEFTLAHIQALGIALNFDGSYFLSSV